MASNGQVVIDVTLDDGQVVSAIANIQNQFGDLQGAMLAIFNRIESVVTSFGSSLSQLGNDYTELNDSISDVTRSSGSLSDVLGEIDRDIDRIDVDELSSDINELDTNITEVERNGSKAFKSLGTAIKGFGVISAGVGLATSALGFSLLSVVEASRELNTDLARLSANATTAGFSVESLEQATLKVAAVSGELDSAVETVSNLAETDFSENQLAEALDYVNGAAIRFSDTLNTEGIADGIQETFAVGEAAGSFAELLERSGVDLEKFNAGLVTATANGTETDYVLQQLAATGLGDTYQAYLDNNQAIVEYNEAQVQAEVNSAKLAERLTPLATEFINVKNTIIDVVLGNKTLSEAFEEVSETVISFGKRIFDLARQVLPDLVKAIIARVPEFIDAGIKFINGLIDGIGNTIPELQASGIKLVSDLLSSIIKRLPDLLETGIRILKVLIDGVVKSLPLVVTTGLNLILLLVKTLLDNLPRLVTAGIDLIASLLSGIVKNVPKITTFFVTSFIPALVKTVTSFNWASLGQAIVRGLIDGIKSLSGSAVEAIGGVVNGVVDKAKSLLKINSPSKVFDSIGGSVNEGLEDGLLKTANKPESAIAGITNDLIDITNPLRGIRPNLGINNSSPIVNNNQNVYNNSSGSQQDMVIQPSNVILDNKVVGEIMFNVVSKKQASAVSIAGLARGLQV